MGCSSGKIPTSPEIEFDMTSDAAASEISQSKTYLLGYYDCMLDIENESIEIVPNRTVDFTLNIVPFLNKMAIPQYGITFDSIVLHNDDPLFLGVDVVFSVYHPFPGYDQYQGYDLMGVVIGDGSSTLSYENLRVAERGTDLYMTNPDGYTRWFNPSEFTTELIFGWAPGGYQNYEGNATLNPYKYYAKHLEKDQDLWSFLTVGPNFDGLFESGIGRTMKLEFPIPDPGISFGYAVVLAWEDEGPDGPYHSYHRDEAVAANITQTPDLYYNEIDGSGGDLILDIDLYAWKQQPITIKLESGVLQNVVPFNAATYASPGGENWSTYHLEIQSDPFVGMEQEVWVIAEYPDFDYSNDLVGIPHADGPLAAFFRLPLFVSDSPFNQPPQCDLTSDPEVPYEGALPVTITFDANGVDPEGGTLIYQWSENGIDWESDAVTKDYEYTENGYYSVFVKVTDIEGDFTICSITDFLVNQPPECDLDSDPILPYSGPMPVDIEFDASGSFDSDGDGITFAWDSDDDGIFDDGSDPTLTVHYDVEGDYIVCVRVTDPYGAQCESCLDFSVVEALDHPWPSWMGGDLNQCASKYVGYGDSSASGTPKWTFAADTQGHAGCIIAQDGSIYFTTWNCALYGVNPDGSEKWKFAPLTPWVSFCPALDDEGYVYTCMGNSSVNYLYKVDPTNGSQVWSCYLGTTPCYASAPSIGHDGSIYVTWSTAYDSGYIQQILPNGTKGWSYWIPSSAYSYSWQLGTAILPNGNIIATGGTHGRILCFEPDGGGVPLWTYQHTSWILHTPAVGPEGNIYFTTWMGGEIVAIDEDGNHLWTYDTGFYMWASPAVDPETGNVFVGDRLGHFRCFTADGDGYGNGDVIWDHVFASTGIDGTAAVDANGDVYVAVGHQPSAPFVGLVKMDGDNGDILWQSDNIGYLVTHAPSIGADGTIYMTGHYADPALYAWGD